MMNVFAHLKYARALKYSELSDASSFPEVGRSVKEKKMFVTKIFWGYKFRNSFSFQIGDRKRRGYI